MSPPLQEDPVAAHERRLVEFVRTLPTFDADDYRTIHADLAAENAVEHYVRYGLSEGRTAISPERLTAKLARAIALNPATPPNLEELERAYRGAAEVTPSIHLPNRPSPVEEALADRLVSALNTVGLDCAVRVGVPNDQDASPLLIAPDALFAGTKLDGPVLSRLRRCMLVATESPRDEAFPRFLPYLLASGGLAAVEVEAFALARSIGLPAVWLGATPSTVVITAPPAYPLSEGLSRLVRFSPPDLPWSERPIDVLAIESASPMRTSAWTRMSEELALLNTVVQAPPPDAPIPPEMRAFLYSRSKMVLHLHETTGQPLTTGLVAETAGAGALLLSEPSQSDGMLQPGVHYFEASARRMPALARRLLASPERAIAAIAAMQATLTSAFDPGLTGPAIVCALQNIGEACP